MNSIGILFILFTQYHLSAGMIFTESINKIECTILKQQAHICNIIFPITAMQSTTNVINKPEGERLLEPFLIKKILLANSIKV